MKKYLIILIAFSQFSTQCTARDEKKSKEIDFERKYEQFKYSLYPDLIKLNRQDIQNFNYPSDLINKINLFLEKNANIISEVQNSMLEEFKNVEIDYTPFKEDSVFNEYKNKSVFNILTEKMPIGKSVFTIYKLNLNPINRIYALISSFGTKMNNLSGENYVTRIMTQYIGGVLVKTKSIKKDSWLIIFNNYYNIFEFEFDSKTQELIFLKLYTRNS